MRREVTKGPLINAILPSELIALMNDREYAAQKEIDEAAALEVGNERESRRVCGGGW